MNTIFRCNIKVDRLFKQNYKVNGMVYIRCKMGIAIHIFVILQVKSAAIICYEYGKVFLLFFSHHHHNLKICQLCASAGNYCTNFQRIFTVIKRLKHRCSALWSVMPFDTVRRTSMQFCFKSCSQQYNFRSYSDLTCSVKNCQNLKVCFGHCWF